MHGAEASTATRQPRTAALASTAPVNGDTFDVNQRWFLRYVEDAAAENPDLRVLDFGCGTGAHLRLLRGAGIDARGTDVFYGGADWSDPRLAELRDRDLVRAMPDPTTIPFPDDSFDLVVSDQVLEHVEDLDAIVRELDRVLRPGGRMYHHFPTLETVREVHIGIPFAHRLPPGRVRHAWVRALRTLGMGKFKKPGEDAAAWTTRVLGWIDDYCHYRHTREIERMAGDRYEIRHAEVEFCRFRAQDRPLLRRVLDVRALAPVWSRAYRRLGCVALELRQKAPALDSPARLADEILTPDATR